MHGNTLLKKFYFAWLCVIIFAAIPVQNPIPVYYSTPVDGSVKIECGISLGKLASAYSVTWIYKVFRDVEDQGGTRFEVIRNSLMDMSLEISSVLLEDNSMYFCEVTISDAGQIVKTFESPAIILIVYGENIID